MTREPRLGREYYTPGGEQPVVERRQLTVVFCDLVGSTTLASRMDPEDLRHVIGAYHRCVADTVQRFGGFVARYMGDGALVYFGYPRAYEDNAERAVRAMLLLLSEIPRLDVSDAPLHVRIGIATGLVVVGELVNAGAAREQTALGETPNLAARLQSIAAIDAIVIAESTHRLVADAFDCEDLGSMPLKGFEAPMRAWRVIAEHRSRRFGAGPGAGAGAAGGAQRPRPLVGRVRELEILRHAWSEVKQGRGQVVLLSGDAGIGKSRLAEALLASLRDEPHTYLEVHCSAYYVNSPLQPVIAVLPAIFGWKRDDSDAIRLDKLTAFCSLQGLEATRSVPLLASLLSVARASDTAAPAMSPERQKQQTLDILLKIVLRFTAENPLVILIEDVHWIDPTSRQLLDLIIDQAPAFPLLVLLTARPDHDARWPAQAHVERLRLARLAGGEAEALVKGIATQTALAAEIIEQIVARTDGIPLFVEELTKMLLESEELRSHDEPQSISGPLAALAIPSTLQDSLAARLDGLGTLKPLVQLCATLGREFSRALLNAVSTSAEDALEPALAQLMLAEFLQQRGALPETVYAFKHAMIQEAAYQSLLKSTRQQYHERIARVLVDRFPGEADAHPEVVALHHTHAGDVDAAIAWWKKAGERTFRRAACAEAIAHFNSALQLVPTIADELGRDRAELGLQLDLGYAFIPLRGWGAPETAQAFSRARALCRRIGDTPGEFRALWGIGAFHFVRGDQHKAREVAEQCLRLAAGSRDDDALIEAHYLVGIVRCVSGEFAAGCDNLETCIRLYGGEARENHRLLYGQDAKASALGWLGMARWAMGEPDEGLLRAREALDFVRRTPQAFLTARGLASVGFVRVFRREAQGPGDELAAALSLCSEQGFTYFHAVVSAFEGANQLITGNTPEAIRLMEAGMATLRAMGSSLLLSPIVGSLASAYIAVGRWDDASAALEDGLAFVERSGERWAESELHRLRGEVYARGRKLAPEAEACFRKALDVARAQQARSYELRAATALAVFWREQARTLEAADLITQVLAGWQDTLDSADLREARALRAALE